MSRKTNNSACKVSHRESGSHVYAWSRPKTIDGSLCEVKGFVTRRTF